MKYGTSIKLFLVDGVSTGIITAGIGQWMGQATVIPKGRLAEFGSRPEARKPAVYVLAGVDPNDEDRERIYIGEAEDVHARLKLHVREKDFWNKACVFTSSDGSLTKAHVKYLESRIIEIAEERGRAVLENGKASTAAALPEAEVSDMEQFLERVLILLPVLNFQFARPRAEVLATIASSIEPAFEYSVKGATAKAREVDGEFVVLKGSSASAKPAKTWENYRKLHEQLLNEGVLAPDPENQELYRFTRDYSFKSPSAAGSVVAASTVSGRAVWRVVGTSETYGEWQDAKIEAGESDSENASIQKVA